MDVAMDDLAVQPSSRRAVQASRRVRGGMAWARVSLVCRTRRASRSAQRAGQIEGHWRVRFGGHSRLLEVRESPCPMTLTRREAGWL